MGRRLRSDLIDMNSGIQDELLERGVIRMPTLLWLISYDDHCIRYTNTGHGAIGSALDSNYNWKKNPEVVGSIPADLTSFLKETQPKAHSHGGKRFSIY